MIIKKENFSKIWMARYIKFLLTSEKYDTEIS